MGVSLAAVFWPEVRHTYPPYSCADAGGSSNRERAAGVENVPWGDRGELRRPPQALWSSPHALGCA